MKPQYRDYFTLTSQGANSQYKFSNTTVPLSSATSPAATFQYLFYEGLAFLNPAYSGTPPTTLQVDSSGNISYLGVYASENVLIEVDNIAIQNSSSSIQSATFAYRTPANPSILINLPTYYVPAQSVTVLEPDDIERLMKAYYTLSGSSTGGSQSGYGLTVSASAAYITVTARAHYVKE